jgi:serine phosphatase RsbU (regulator of sigma subunit)
MIKPHGQFVRALILVCGLLLFLPAFGSASPEMVHTEQLLQTSLKKKDWRMASHHAYALAKTHWQAKEAEQALKYLDQCVGYCRKAGDQQLLLSAYQDMGTIYAGTLNHSKALSPYQRALKLAKELNKATAINDNLLQLALSYQQLGKPKKAIEQLDELLSLALRQNDLPLQERCYSLLIQNWQQLDNRIKVGELSSLLALVRDQQIEKQTEKELLQTATALQTTQKTLIQTESSLQEATSLNEMRQMEIDLLNKERELAELHILEQNTRFEYSALIRNSSIAGLLMSLALITVMVRSHRRKQQANAKIEKQNKNISSSINYARRIQEAMLPTAELQQELLPESFVLFKPRDSVSGDFYLITEVKSWYSPDVVIAAADCTGHGVPGAFMSLIGINALNSIISRGVAESNLILEALDREIRESLRQETSGNQDGMDIALCIYRKEKGVLEFSGAKNPLVYIQGGELFQIKGDILSIGGRPGKKERCFKQHLLSIDEPTMVYLFSDGFRDQFGEGEKGKFMSKRFNQLLLDIHQLPLAEQQQLLEKEFTNWKGATPQTDDVLVIGLRLTPLE